MFFETRGDGPEVLDLVEEALDEVAVSVEEGAECGLGLAMRQWPDAGPPALVGEPLAQGVRVVGPIGQQDLSFANGAQHILGRAPVVRLSRRQLEPDGQSIGINQGMDLGRQTASRAPHASGVSGTSGAGVGPPFFAFAPCW